MNSDRPFYNEFAWAYDLLQAEPIVTRVDFMEGLLSRNGILHGSKILDAGCGTGRYAVELPNVDSGSAALIGRPN
jgi:ubiquinone/menaquinone biosynthesis C-methylase UbiE